MFTWRNQGRLICILCAHVDDIIWTCPSGWDGLHHLKEAFKYGSWQTASLVLPAELELCRKRLQAQLGKRGEPHSILLHQAPFAAGLETKKITMRGRECPQLIKVEISGVRIYSWMLAVACRS